MGWEREGRVLASSKQSRFFLWQRAENASSIRPRDGRRKSPLPGAPLQLVGHSVRRRGCSAAPTARTIC